MAFSGRPVALLLALSLALRAADSPEYTQAVDAIQKRDWSTAHQRIGELLKRSPANTKFLNLQALAFLGEGKAIEAIAAFQSAIHIDPQFFPALKNLTILEWSTGRDRDARDHLRAALKLWTNDPVLNVYAAIVALEQKNSPAAKAHLSVGTGKIAELDPSIEFQLASAWAANQQYREAARHFESVVVRAPDSYNARYNLGLCYFLAGDSQRATETLAALRSRRVTSEVSNLLARVQKTMGRIEDAVALLREASTIDPSDEANYLDLSTLYLEREAHDLAMEAVETGLRAKPASERLIFQRGLLHSTMGHFDAAESDFELASRLAPDSGLPAAGLSLTAIQRGELPEVIARLRARLPSHGGDAVLQYLLGVALIRSGADAEDLREAESTFETATRLDPRFVRPYIELAKIYLRTDRVQLAIPLLEKASELASGERSIYAQLAVAYRRAGKPELAARMIDYVRALVETGQRNPTKNSDLRP